jgi:two-component sensor histidine kinase
LENGLNSYLAVVVFQLAPNMKKWMKYGLVMTVCAIISGLVFFAVPPNRPHIFVQFPAAKDTVLINSYLHNADTTFYSAAETDIRINKVLRLATLAENRSNVSGYRYGQAKSYFWKSKAFLLERSLDSARIYAVRAIDIFSSTRAFVEQARTHYQLGDTYGMEGEDMVERIKQYEQAARLFDLGHSLQECTNTLQLLADFCMMSGDHLKSRRILKNLINILEKANIPNQKGAYNLLNLVEVRLGNYQQAYAYGLKALAIAKNMKDSSGELGSIYNRIAVALFRLKRYDSSIIYCKWALAISLKNRDLEAAWQVTSNLVDAFNRAGFYDSTIAVISRVPAGQSPIYGETRVRFDLFLLGAYTGKGDVVRGQPLSESLYRRIVHNSKGMNKFAYLEIIKFNLKTRQVRKARALIREAATLFREANASDALRHLINYQYEADSLENNWPAAINTYIEGKKITDSIFVISWQKQVSQLEKQFHAEMELKAQMKKQQADLLEANIQLRSAELATTKTRYLLILFGAAILFIFGAILYRIYNLKQRNNLLLHQQKEQIDRQNASLKRLVDNQVKLIAEKEWLVREVHHRVKNNLQIVVSLLNIQSKFLKDEMALAAIRTSQQRLRIISFIHQHLYQTETLRTVDVNQYIHKLVAYLKDGMDGAASVDFQLHIAAIEMDAGEVVAIGLILNEVVTNAARHAFPGRSAGIVKIGLNRSVDGFFTFSVQDNGVGLPQDFDWRQSQSAGFTLINMMGDQLKASLHINGENGLALEFRFRPGNVISKNKITKTIYEGPA